MNEEIVSALARALGVPLRAEGLTEVAAQLQGQISEQGGLSAEELDGVEPAIVFEPEWDE